MGCEVKERKNGKCITKNSFVKRKGKEWRIGELFN